MYPPAHAPVRRVLRALARAIPALLLAVGAACRDDATPTLEPAARSGFTTPRPTGKLRSAATMPALLGTTPPEWIPNQYIVVFKQSYPDPDGVAASILARLGGSVVQRYGSAIKGITLSIPDSYAQALAESENVEFVEQDQMAHGTAVQSAAPWSIDRLDQRAGYDGKYTYYADGTGVTIYILDSGINFSHTDFGGRASLGADFIDSPAGPADCNGHGTQVAGLAGGTQYGVAKNAKLVAVRVLPCSLDQPVSTIISGVDWVTANRRLPAVANMSISVNHSDALDQAITNSIAAGVTYVVAAGNHADEAGVSANACDFSPGSVAGALTVGAIDSLNYVTSWSKTGPCVDVFAPGSVVPSDGIGSNTATVVNNGTSMSSPLVAGAAALYLQLNPTSTPAQVHAAVVNAATPNAISYRFPNGDLPAGTPNLLVYTAFGDPSPTPAIARVDLTVPSRTLGVGQTTTAVAALKGVTGALLSGRTVTWTSSDANVVNVSATGVVTAVASGLARVTATSEGIRSTPVTVIVPLPSPPPGGAAVVNAKGLGCVTAAEAVQAMTTTVCATGALTQTFNVPAVGVQGTITLAGVAGCLTALNGGGAGQAVGIFACLGWVEQQWTLTTAGELRSGAGNCITANPYAMSVRLEMYPCDGTLYQKWTVGGTPPGAPVAAVTAVLPTPSVATGRTMQAAVLLRDALSQPLVGRVVTWASSNTAVATVSVTGVITGVAVGTANITATSEGISNAVPLSVTPPTVAPVATVGVAIVPSTIQTAQTATATATLKDATGAVLTGRTVTWSTSNALVATVSATGVVTGVAPGTATITATSEGKSGTAPITVTLPPPLAVATVALTLPQASMASGATQTATAVLKDSLGGVLTGRTVTWASSNTGVATISTSGVITAALAGTTTITATSEGKSATATLTVTGGAVSTVAVSLGASSVAVGATTPSTVVLKDAAGNTLTGRTITYATSASGIATVSTSGVVTAVAPGTATITATSEGKSGAATLTVTSIAVSTVTVSLAPTSVPVGQTSTGTAVTKDASGNVLSGRAVTWSSSNTGVATVSAAGVVTGVAAGSATITATSEGKSGTATITVTVVPVATVGVTIGDATLFVAQTSSATATLKDAGGNTLTGRTVTWSSSNTSVATVSATGVVTGVAPGTATITATSEGKAGTVSVTVSLAPVATVGVTIDDASLIYLQTAQATATLKDASGNALTGRSITWSSSNTSVATVTSTGVVTTVAAGTVTITATSEGKSGTVSVSVTRPAVASVALTIADASLTLPQTSQATATVKDASGNALAGRTVTWSSSNTGVATVSSTGLVTGVAAGSATITATSEGKSGTVSVAVTGATVASVTTTVADASLEVGQTSAATPTAKDASGRVVTGRTFTWSSSNTGIATVSASGVVTAVGAGTVTITASTGGKSGSVTLTVAPLPSAQVDIACYRSACAFDARESTNTVTWAWTWGDGSTQTDNDGWTYHVYDDDVSKTYTVTLKVTNAGGTTRSITRSVVCRNGSCSAP